MSLPALRDLLNEHFNNAELNQLCFDLGIEYENLPGPKTRIGKAQSLVEHCLRHGRLPDLLTHCHIQRPHVAWPDVATTLSELSQTQPDSQPAATTPVGGIQARTIQATNVVVGIQQAGGDHTTIPDPAVLAAALRHGRITADNIEAENIVSGIQHLANPPEASEKK
ncbi:MAG: hypothetical protein HND44_10705 [Chloroflexi bacterium]|nr:hypothetical protein [Ardenticatenaceae bacterium]MBL1128946.1 hypothetical protein [Chloroflexota bacterium]NOG35026.1 hypothetical protein [Chloroflexota bacterium]GIK58136.1 MAG: hypothetical protein BroJett015_37990 [Chloroflexota bacterium]